MPTSAVRKPAGSRVQLSASPGRLDVDIPSQGLSGDNIGTGLFALAWNAFVAFWTVRHDTHDRITHKNMCLNSNSFKHPTT